MLPIEAGIRSPPCILLQKFSQGRDCMYVRLCLPTLKKIKLTPPRLHPLNFHVTVHSEVSFSSFTPTMSSELETKDGEDALAKMMEASLDVSDEGAETNEPPSAAPATPEVAKASAKAGEAAVRKSTPAAPAATSAPKPAIQARKSDPLPSGSVTLSQKRAANSSLQRSPSGVGGFANATGASSSRASTGSSNMRGRANTSDDVSTGGGECVRQSM